MTYQYDMTVDLSTGATAVLTRKTFDEVALFELLEMVCESSEEYKHLAQRASQIDEYLGDFDVEDRLLRKAAVDVSLGFAKHAQYLLENRDCRLSHLIRAKAMQMLDRHSNAVIEFEKAASMTSAPTLQEVISHSYSLALNGRLDKAEALLNGLGKAVSDMPFARVVRALITEYKGEYESALSMYSDVLKKHPGHPEATFRLAMLLDTRGEDQVLVEELYLSLADGDVFHLGAAINLGLFYVDHDKFEHAEAMFNKILRYDPDNAKVWLFIRDTQSSNSMVMDDGRTKEDEKLRQILRLPISEFELSVRSRNCLSRMNVHTLGDLISKSETELLAYKNFGETSLKEIREILARKGLRLGMAREEVERKMRSPSQRLAALAVTDNILDQPISALSLSIRTLRSLEGLDIDTVRDLTRYSERSLLASKNFGLTGLTEVKKKLASYGLNLSTDEL